MVTTSGARVPSPHLISPPLPSSPLLVVLPDQEDEKDDEDEEEGSGDADVSVGRFVRYQFTPAFLRLRTVGAT